MESRNLKIVEDYLNGVSNGELSKKYKLHRVTIRRILLKYGIKLHKNKSFIKCNRKFFSKYTVESCYWAGFILADGNIRKNRNSLQLKVALEDKNHLIKFLKSIECDELDRIKEYHYEYPYVSLTISLDEFKNDLLNNFDIGPNKTYSAIVSDKIPKDKLKHFIRGYIDGDGSITKTTCPTLSLVGTVQVLDYLSKFFKKELKVILKSKNDTPPICNLKNGIGSISYSGKNANKILTELYSNITSNIFLERKFIKFKELYNER
jgi:hypothetical protein